MNDEKLKNKLENNLENKLENNSENKEAQMREDKVSENQALENQITENQIEVVKKYVRFEENISEYIKLIYKRHKKLINVLSLVLLVIFVYVILILSAKSNKQDEDIENMDILIESKTNKTEDSETEQNPENTFKAKEKISGKVYITGEVEKPGVYDIKEGDRIEDIITYAGGTTKSANLEIINLSEIVADEQHIIIPNINESIENIDNLNSNNGSSKSSDATKVNINKASLEELKSISGVGDTIATSIIQYREENGNFKHIEEIKNVAGVGEKSFEKMKSQITVKWCEKSLKNE